jgi:hypothetical protein
MILENAGEPGVDRLRERQPLVGIAPDGAARELRHSGGIAQREGQHHLLGRLHLPPCGRLERPLADPIPRNEVLVGQLVPARVAGGDEPPAGREQRVTREVGPDVWP